MFPATQEDFQTYHPQWEKLALVLCPPSPLVANVGHEGEALEKWAQVMNRSLEHLVVGTEKTSECSLVAMLYIVICTSA